MNVKNLPKSAKTGETRPLVKEIQVPNGIAIKGDSDKIISNFIEIISDDRLVVSYCNQTRWEWWEWDILEDGSLSDHRVLVDLTGKVSGQGKSLKKF